MSEPAAEPREAPTAPPDASVAPPGDPQTVTIERVPWSVLGPEFAAVWGRADPANPQPEHAEIIGMNGSGKTHLLLKILQDRMIVRRSHITLIVTKRSDSIFQKLGWPIVRDVRDVRKYRVCIFWPQTNLIGQQRKAFHESRIYDLLAQMWQPEANRVIAFDEIAYVESLSPRIKDLVQMYLREGRSNGITLVLTKQRPQGVQRDMHSETWWTFAFIPKDRNDAERFAELLGNRRDWLPVIDQIDPDSHEFIVKYTRTRQAYISWVDEPLRAVKPPENDTGTLASFGRR